MQWGGLGDSESCIRAPPYTPCMHANIPHVCMPPPLPSACSFAPHVCMHADPLCTPSSLPSCRCSANQCLALLTTSCMHAPLSAAHHLTPDARMPPPPRPSTCCSPPHAAYPSVCCSPPHACMPLCLLLTTSRLMHACTPPPAPLYLLLTSPCMHAPLSAAHHHMHACPSACCSLPHA